MTATRNRRRAVNRCDGGVLVYLFMNFVVIPLSMFPLKLLYPPLRLLQGFASHAVFAGIPIALAIRWTGPHR